jgi:hypothetical protein
MISTGRNSNQDQAQHSCYLFWRKEKAKPRFKKLAVTEGLVALYAEKLLLDLSQLLNDLGQVVLNKKSKDEHAQNTNQSHPNQCADSIEIIWG